MAPVLHSGVWQGLGLSHSGVARSPGTPEPSLAWLWRARWEWGRILGKQLGPCLWGACLKRALLFAEFPGPPAAASVGFGSVPGPFTSTRPFTGRPVVAGGN